jgi:uncharacterized RDD family membrane protein YckC
LSDYQLHIDTPENLVLEAEVAGFGSRCIAALIDYIILAIVMIGVALAMAAAFVDINSDTNAFIGALFILVEFVLFVFYHLIFELIWNGQTPGKRLFGLRVVQANGMPVTISGVLIRNIVRLFDFLPVFYGIGLILMFITKRSQRFGDMAARTIVVYERPQMTLQTIKQQAAIAYRFTIPEEELPAPDELTLLTAQDRQLVSDYLQRRYQIQNEDVAMRLAKHLASKMGHTGNLWEFNRLAYAERFLEGIARAVEREQRGSQ